MPLRKYPPQIQASVDWNGLVDYLGGASEEAKLLPTGLILMWHGTVASIPSGWALCDGENGTPDLRDRFIVGAKQDDAGVAKTNVSGSLTQLGGSPTHSHSAHSDHQVTQPSDHTISAHSGAAVGDHTGLSHSVSQPNDHTISAHVGAAVADHAAKNTDAADTGATAKGSTSSTLTLKAHFHNISAYIHSVTQPSAHSTLTHAGAAVAAHGSAGTITHSVTQPSAHSNLSHSGAAVNAHSAHSTESNLTPYYALCFIMRL